MIIIAGISALELWDKGLASRVESCDIGKLDLSTVDAHGLQQQKPWELGISEPGHLLVPSDGYRPYTKLWRCHTWGKELPTGSLYRAKTREELYIASPEFCYLQLAQSIGFLDSIKLGMELCGWYSTLVPEGREYRKRPPLTSIERLDEYVRQACAAGGRSLAERSLKEVAPNSASPMETASKILLCLPRRYGCPRFRTPELNKRVEIAEEEKRLLGTQFLRTDLRWGDVVLEYKGIGSHTRTGDLAHDTARENVLRSKGLNVISATYNSLCTEEGFAALTAALANAMDIRIRRNAKDMPQYLECQAQTRAIVLRGKTCSWCNR